MSAAIGKKSPKGVASPSVSPRKKSQTLGLNAKRVVSKRYSLKPKGKAIEEWADIVRRVVGHVSQAERDAEKRDQFFAAMREVMLESEFLPNTP